MLSRGVGGCPPENWVSPTRKPRLLGASDFGAMPGFLNPYLNAKAINTMVKALRITNNNASSECVGRGLIRI